MNIRRLLDTPPHIITSSELDNCAAIMAILADDNCRPDLAALALELAPTPTPAPAPAQTESIIIDPASMDFFNWALSIYNSQYNSQAKVSQVSVFRPQPAQGSANNPIVLDETTEEEATAFHLARLY